MYTRTQWYVLPSVRLGGLLLLVLSSGKTIEAMRSIFQDPMSNPYHIFREYTHVRQYEAGALSVAGYDADWVKVGFKYSNIPSEVQARQYGTPLADVFARTPESRSCVQ